MTTHVGVIIRSRKRGKGTVFRWRKIKMGKSEERGEGTWDERRKKNGAFWSLWVSF